CIERVNIKKKMAAADLLLQPSAVTWPVLLRFGRSGHAPQSPARRCLRIAAVRKSATRALIVWGMPMLQMIGRTGVRRTWFLHAAVLGYVMWGLGSANAHAQQAAAKPADGSPASPTTAAESQRGPRLYQGFSGYARKVTT